MLIFLDSECESGPRKDYWRILATHSLKVLKLMFLKCVERQTMESSNGESFKGYSRTFSVHVNPGFDAGGGRVFTLARQPKHRRDLPVLGSVLSHPSISDHTVCGIWRLPVWTAEFSTLGRERDRQRSNALQLLPINATSAFSLQLKSNFTGIRFRYTVDFLRGGWEEREKKKKPLCSADQRRPMGMFVSFGWRATLCLVFIKSFQMSQDSSVIDEQENRETQVAWSQASLLLLLSSLLYCGPHK